MILPIQYLWKQLDGPQVKGLTKGVEEYWKSLFDDKLDYFNNISIDTANDDHLTLMGLLSGLIRPVIQEPDKTFFYFTEQAEHNFPHGFSDLDNLESGGGLFSKVDNKSLQNVTLDTEYYRALLRAWDRGQGEIGSLMLLDDICAELTALDTGNEPTYRFDIMEGKNIPLDRAPGDVYIDMGSASEWNNPLHVYAVLMGIGDTVYSPQPRLFVSLGLSGRVSTPVASRDTGIFSEPFTVTLSVANPPDAVIYYTTDGTNPTRDSDVYTEAINITQTTDLRALAVAPEFGDSAIARWLYKIE